MIEQESIQQYKIEKQDLFFDGQMIRLVDQNRATIADHIIIPESKAETAFLYSQTQCPELKDTSYTVFEGAIHSFKPNSGIGTSLWKYGELSFFQTQSKPYYRFIHDMSENRWTERKIPELLEYLKSQKVPINFVWKGTFLGDRNAWIFLFGKNN